MDIKTQTLYTVDVPTGRLVLSGINIISKYLRSKGIDIPIPFDVIGTEWVVGGKSEYVGTFPKRLSKYFYNEHHISLSSDMLTIIGTIAQRHSSDNVKKHRFDFTTKFDWSAGVFGDMSSCFWDNQKPLRIIHDNGGYAVRFYAQGVEYVYDSFAEDEKKKQLSYHKLYQYGLARAWFVRDTPQKDCAVIFNGYGMGSDTTLKIARILSVHFGCCYKEVRLYNNGSPRGIIWINSKQTVNGDLRPRGLLLAPLDILNQYDKDDRIDLNWDENPS